MWREWWLIKVCTFLVYIVDPAAPDRLLRAPLLRFSVGALAKLWSASDMVYFLLVKFPPPLTIPLRLTLLLWVIGTPTMDFFYTDLLLWLGDWFCSGFSSLVDWCEGFSLMRDGWEASLEAPSSLYLLARIWVPSPPCQVWPSSRRLVVEPSWSISVLRTV